MTYQDFVKRFAPELKKAHPDWEQQKAISEAAVLWNQYKVTKVLPTIQAPTTPIQPPPPPTPTTNIRFSKNPTESILTITEDDKVIYTLHYVGQAHVWETILKQVLETVGAARFKEYVKQLTVLNNNLLK
jgi:hypothetical protein